MTVVLGKVMPWKGKVAIGMTAAASHTSKRKKQEMTCAEPLPGGSKLPRCTRQKEKSKKWRVRSRPRRLQTAALHTSKRKKQELACAEPPPASPNCRAAHVKKKKARNNVCGAAPAGSKLPRRTRQKEKSKKWRVRSRPHRLQTAMSHTLKRKKQEMPCAEPPPALATPAPARATPQA